LIGLLVHVPDPIDPAGWTCSYIDSANDFHRSGHCNCVRTCKWITRALRDPADTVKGMAILDYSLILSIWVESLHFIFKKSVKKEIFIK
jgi:hypothetical protein